MGGAVDNPMDSAMLLFKADSPSVAEEFAKQDPYVLNGLVERWVTVPEAGDVEEDVALAPTRIAGEVRRGGKPASGYSVEAGLISAGRPPGARALSRTHSRSRWPRRRCASSPRGRRREL